MDESVVKIKFVLVKANGVCTRAPIYLVGIYLSVPICVAKSNLVYNSS